MQQLQQSNQLADAAKVEQQTALLKEQNSNQLNMLKLGENARQFDTKVALDDKHHTEDVAVDLTKIEVTSGKDVSPLV
jgi:hypothetical protein